MKALLAPFAGSLLLAGTVAAADPLADFEAIVRGCKAALDAAPALEVVYVDLAKSWVKRARTPAIVTYDVRRTESLVAPLVAHIEVGVTHTSDRAASQEDAQKIDLAGKTPIRHVDRINFALRDGRWEVVDGRFTSTMAGGPPSSGVMSRAEILTRKGPLGSCVSP
jgi:hypothetical protein